MVTIAKLPKGQIDLTRKVLLELKQVCMTKNAAPGIGLMVCVLVKNHRQQSFGMGAWQVVSHVIQNHHPGYARNALGLYCKSWPRDCRTTVRGPIGVALSCKIIQY